MEDFVDQLKEQVSMLSVYLEEEQKRHEKKEETLANEHDQAVADLEKRHQEDILALGRKHEEYVALLKRHHKSIVSLVEETLQERITRLRNEYALLQAALRNYKDCVRSDFGKIWAEKENTIRLASEEKAGDMVRKVKLKMERQQEMEKEELIEKYEQEMDERVKYAVDKALSAVAAETDQSRIVHLHSDNIIPEEAGTYCSETSGNIASAAAENKCQEVPENHTAGSEKRQKEGGAEAPVSVCSEYDEDVENCHTEALVKSSSEGEKKDEGGCVKEPGCADIPADALEYDQPQKEIDPNVDTSSDGSTVFSQTICEIVRPSAAALFSGETLSYFPESPEVDDDLLFFGSDLISSDSVSCSTDVEKGPGINELFLENMSDDEIGP